MPETRYELYPACDAHTACYQSIETQLRGQPGIHLNKQAAYIDTTPSDTQPRNIILMKTYLLGVNRQ